MIVILIIIIIYFPNLSLFYPFLFLLLYRLKNDNNETPLSLADESNDDMKDLLSTVLVYDEEEEC